MFQGSQARYNQKAPRTLLQWIPRSTQTPCLASRQAVVPDETRGRNDSALLSLHSFTCSVTFHSSLHKDGTGTLFASKSPTPYRTTFCPPPVGTTCISVPNPLLARAHLSAGKLSRFRPIHPLLALRTHLERRALSKVYKGFMRRQNPASN